jgi:hypothetical protein
MLYVKCLFLGVVAFVVASIVYIPVAAFVLRWKYRPPGVPVSHVAVNVFALIHSPVYWLIAIAACVLGCYLAFQKAGG